jgi:hypothetical protein
MIRFFVSTIFVLFVSAGLSAEVKAVPNCSVPPIRTLENQTVNGTMTVKAGTRCSIILRSSSGPMETTSIVAQSSHGALRVSGNSVFYQPRKGFVGNDAFTYARSGLDTRNNKVKRTVSIAVEVTP